MDVDEIIMEEDEQATNSVMFNPITSGLQFLANYGWWVVGAAAVALWLHSKLRPRVEAWRQAREDAEYHKDPDRALARMEAVQAARERQQQLLEESSRRALEQQKEREEKKKRELAERLEKYGAAVAGNKLGSADAGGRTYRDPHLSSMTKAFGKVETIVGTVGDEPNGYLPLSGGASTSSYKAPKRKACGGGGCGR